VSTTPQAYRGERIGLPESGRGSLANGGRRVAAFAVDAIVCAVIAGIFTRSFGTDTASKLPGLWSLVTFSLDYIAGLLFAGRTLGMYLLGIRVIRIDRDEPVNPWRAVLRTFLLVLLVPALIFDRDGRGLHDRYTDTAVVNN
jgi:uncharacterized RDD family membrane protein YckC